MEKRRNVTGAMMLVHKESKTAVLGQYQVCSGVSIFAEHAYS